MEGGQDLRGLLSSAGANITNVSGEMMGDAINDAFNNALGGYETPDRTRRPTATGGAYEGGGLSNIDVTNPQEITNFLENTPEGQDLINNYVNNTTNQNMNQNMGENINIVFSPLEIRYDGNTIRLTPNQVREVLPPLFDEIALGVSKSGSKSTTPS